MLEAIKKDFFNASLYERYIALSIFISPVAITVHAKSGSVITGLLLLSSLFFCWKKVKLTTIEKAFFASLLLFLLTLALSIVESDITNEGISRLGRYLKLLFIIPFYLVIIKINKSNISIFLVYGSALACVFGAGISIYDMQLIESDRARGEHHPIFFGMCMATFSLLVFSYLVDTKKFNPKEKYLLIAALSSGLYACLMSGTRGAWLVFPVLLLLWSIRNRNMYALISLLALTTILTSSYFIFPESYPSKRITHAVKDIKGVINQPKSCSSLGARVNMWRNAVLMASSESWLLGSGLGDFRVESEKLIKQKKSKAKCGIIREHTAHSNYFHTFAESGILGLGGLTIFLMIAFLMGYQKNISSLFVIASFIVFGISTTWLAKSLSIHIFILYFIISLQVNKSYKPCLYENSSSI